MSDDLTNKVRRYSSLFDRGLLTAREFANGLFDLYAESKASDDDIAAAFGVVPDEMMQTFQKELHELANVDFYRRTFGIGDTHTEDEVHADALARQPTLRRVCRILTPLVLVRMAR